MKKKDRIKLLSLTTVVFAAWLFVLLAIDNGELSIGDAVFHSAIVFTPLTVWFIAVMKGLIWRVQNGVNLFVNLKTNPIEIKLQMYRLMSDEYFNRRMHVLETMDELDKIIRNYPQWKLDEWEVYQSWYKAKIDHMLEHPESHNLKWDDGTPYCKELDYKYNASAPDWDSLDKLSEFRNGSLSRNDDTGQES